MCAVYPDARNPFAFVGQPASDLERLGGRRGVDPERARGRRRRRHHRRRSIARCRRCCATSANTGPGRAPGPHARHGGVGRGSERPPRRLELRSVPRRRHPLTGVAEHGARHGERVTCRRSRRGRRAGRRRAAGRWRRGSPVRSGSIPSSRPQGVAEEVERGDEPAADDDEVDIEFVDDRGEERPEPPAVVANRLADDRVVDERLERRRLDAEPIGQTRAPRARRRRGRRSVGRWASFSISRSPTISTTSTAVGQARAETGADRHGEHARRRSGPSRTPPRPCRPPPSRGRTRSAASARSGPARHQPATKLGAKIEPVDRLELVEAADQRPASRDVEGSGKPDRQPDDVRVRRGPDAVRRRPERVAPARSRRIPSNGSGATGPSSTRIALRPTVQRSDARRASTTPDLIDVPPTSRLTMLLIGPQRRAPGSGLVAAACSSLP